MTSTQFDNLLEWLTELKKVLYLTKFFIYIKNTNQDQPNEGTHKVRSERVQNTELLCPFHIESGCVILLASQCVLQPGSYTKLLCPEFLLRFTQYTSLTESPAMWSNSVSRLHFRPPEVGWLDWYHVAQSPNPLMWLVLLALPVPILSHLNSTSHPGAHHESPH